MTLIAKIYTKKYLKQESSESIEFKAGKSSSAVTTQPLMQKVGNFVLVDTVGSNDPNRTDEFIHFETIN